MSRTPRGAAPRARARASRAVAPRAHARQRGRLGRRRLGGARGRGCVRASRAAPPQGSAWPPGGGVPLPAAPPLPGALAGGRARRMGPTFGRETAKLERPRWGRLPDEVRCARMSRLCVAGPQLPAPLARAAPLIPRSADARGLLSVSGPEPAASWGRADGALPGRRLAGLSGY